MRDLAQMLAHIHDAEIEISEGAEPPARDARSKKVRPRIAPRPDLTGARGTSARAAISFYVAIPA